MNLWHLYGLMVFLNASIVLHGMELTEHEKALSPAARIIRRHLFSEKQLVRYFDVDSVYTLVPNNVHDLLNSLPHVVYASPNIANYYDSSHGISCVIRPRKRLIIANTKSKSIIIGKSSYKIYEKDAFPICSLAYTPACVAAGFCDGSFAVRHLCQEKVDVFPPCHKGPVTSICMPSPRTYVLGGGETVSIHIVRNAKKRINDGELLAFDSKAMWLGTDKRGNPYCGDIVAIAGPLIVMQTKKNRPIVRSLYSVNAFNAIQGGTFTGPQENFLIRMIDAQDNKLPMEPSEKDHEIFGSLCPTIQNVLSHGWNN